MSGSLQQQKNKSVDLINRASEVLNKIDASTDLETLKKIKVKVTKDKTLLLVCGECKVGKSSLLTEMMGDYDLFPINADVATNNITMVSYGETEKITVSMENPAENQGKFKGKDKIIHRSEINQYATEQGNKNNQKRVQMIHIETPNEKLQGGLILIDTPGVGGLDEDHSVVTATFIPEADAIIYASESTKPLDTYELEFIQKSISPYCDNIVFVLTKSDTVIKEQRENIRDTNREKIAQYTNWDPATIKIIPISSLAMKSFRHSQKKWHYIASNFAEMDQLITEMTTTRRIKKMLLPNLNNLKFILTENGKIQIAKYNTLITADNETIKKLKKDLIQFNEQKTVLLNKNASWRLSLAKKLRLLNNEMLDFTKKSIRDARKQLDEDTNIKCIIKKQEHAQTYIKDFNRKLNDMVIELQNVCESLSREMLTEIEEELSKELTPFRIKGFDGDISLSAYNSKKMIKFSETAFNASRNVLMSAGIGSAIGSTLFYMGATTIALPVTLALLVAGGLMAAKRAIQSSKQNNNGIVNSTVRTMIEDTSNAMSDLIKNSKDEIETYFVLEIENYIKSEAEKYNNILKDIPVQIENSKVEMRQKAELTKLIVDEIKQLIKEIDELCVDYDKISVAMHLENQKKAIFYQEKIKAMKEEMQYHESEYTGQNQTEENQTEENQTTENQTAVEEAFRELF